jgi:hypothetical protein
MMVNVCMKHIGAAAVVAASGVSVALAPAAAADPGVSLYQQYAYSSAVGPNGQSLGATLAGGNYPNSTGMWIGCEGQAASTTYHLDGKFTQLNAVVGLQPFTPDGLSAHVAIAADGQMLQRFEVDKTANIPVHLTLNGMNNLTVAAIRTTGICGPSPIPYGAFGDGALVPA